MRQLILCTLLLLPGCALLPNEETSKEAARATSSIANEQTQSLRAIMQATKPVDHQSTEISYSGSSKQQSSTDQAAQSDLESSLPAGSKLILLGIGLVILTAGLFLLKKFLNKSAAFKSISTATDETLSASIDWLRNKAANSSNSKEVADLMTEVSNLEKKRGKLKNKSA